ncbi:hypothetical protein HRbin11_02181 [bacterium HR11]|nr:hypothetical protein HRbin11_02181 [bacterium HR11]
MGRLRTWLMLVTLVGVAACEREEGPTGPPPKPPPVPGLITSELVVPSPGLILLRLQPYPVPLPLSVLHIELRSNAPILRVWDRFNPYEILVAVDLRTLADVTLQFCDIQTGLCSLPAVVRVIPGEEPVPKLTPRPLPNAFPEGIPGIDYEFVREYLRVLGLPQKCEVKLSFVSSCQEAAGGMPVPPCGGAMWVYNPPCLLSRWNETWMALHEFFHSVGLHHYCAAPTLMWGGECGSGWAKDTTFFLTPSQLRWLRET